MHEPMRRRTPSPWVWAVAGVLALTALTASSLHFVTAACAVARPPQAVPADGRAFFYNVGPARAVAFARSRIRPRAPRWSATGWPATRRCPAGLRIAQSTSAGWLAVQVINHGNPLASVQVAPVLSSQAQTSRRPLRLAPDDYRVAGSGAGPGPFRIKIIDIYGHQVVARGIRLTPGSVQSAGSYMYRAAPRRRAAPGTTTASPIPRQARTVSPAARSASPAATANPHC